MLPVERNFIEIEQQYHGLKKSCPRKLSATIKYLEADQKKMGLTDTVQWPRKITAAIWW